MMPYEETKSECTGSRRRYNKEEYKELSTDVATASKERKQCKNEVIDAVIQGALTT